MQKKKRCIFTCRKKEVRPWPGPAADDGGVVAAGHPVRRGTARAVQDGGGGQHPVGPAVDEHRALSVPGQRCHASLPAPAAWPEGKGRAGRAGSKLEWQNGNTKNTANCFVFFRGWVPHVFSPNTSINPCATKPRHINETHAFVCDTQSPRPRHYQEKKDWCESGIAVGKLQRDGRRQSE